VVMIVNHTPAIGAKPATRILYIGQNADEICDLVSPHVGTIDIAYAGSVTDAMAMASKPPRDIVIVDQRDESLATKLVLPLITALDGSTKLVVIAKLSSVGAYLRVPGVARVISAPVREAQLVRVLGLDPSKRRHDKIMLEHEVAKEQAVTLGLPAPDPHAKPPPPKRSPLGIAISNFGMKLVSTAYKRLAFVLLGTLFIAFTFYGGLIGFYLTSNGWSMPQHLSRGRPVVDKLARDITDLQVAGNVNNQRLTEAMQKAETAQHSMQDAQILVNYATDTVGKEIKTRQRRLSVIERNINRTAGVHSTFQRQISNGGMEHDLARLYSRRLIDKQTFQSGTMGLLETGQRMAGMQTDIDKLQDEKAQLEQSVQMLQSLKTQLGHVGPIGSVTAATADLLLLTKQSIDARAALDAARGEMDLADRILKDLLSTKKAIESQLVEAQRSAIGRATIAPVDVLFVPYTNQARYAEGTPLYTCRLTFVLCWKAGTIGEAIPGEVHVVHPFFGKPIRGTFVEAKLSDPAAVNREIIHAGRPPLYFF
jgi:hypothetical protein